MAQGRVRGLDDMGRLTLPAEYREAIDIKGGDPIEMQMMNNVVILQPAIKPYTGTKRKLDHLGRITIPIEFRRSMNLECNEKMDMILNSKEIIIKRDKDKICTFCSGEKNLIEKNEKYICETCLIEMFQKKTEEEKNEK
jgi:transcriptional pleiotropic regulator of transition state genes